MQNSLMTVNTVSGAPYLRTSLRKFDAVTVRFRGRLVTLNQPTNVFESTLNRTITIQSPEKTLRRVPASELTFVTMYPRGEAPINL